MGQLDDVARDSAEVAATAIDVMAWLERNRNQVGNGYARSWRTARRQAFDCRRLEKAARRPPGICVYGESQVGKSYLVATLARKPGPPLFAVLGDEKVPFLEQISPDLTGESTGLVTRFTLRQSRAPKSHPVEVRLLGQTDLLKVLVNTYANDFVLSDDDAVSEAEVGKALSRAEALAPSTKPDHLTEVEIEDLKDYCNNLYKSRQIFEILNQTDYWGRLETLAPTLGLDERLKLFEFLWGRHAKFSELYAKLYGLLERLGFPEFAYCPTSVLLPKSESIIGVNILDKIDSPDVASVEIVSDNGKRTTESKARIGAVIAELIIAIGNEPLNSHLATVDLLDFPGARSRKRFDNAALYLANHGVALPYRRGKVDFLFHRYCAERELTSMLLLVKPGNQDIPDLPGLITSWLQIFQGGKGPDQRAEIQTALYVVGAQFDIYFNEAEGKRLSIETWTAALKNVLVDLFGKDADNWVANWRPGQPFNNFYWFRNPSYKARGLMTFDENDNERGILDPGRIEKAKASYLQNDLINKHIAEPARAWDEAFKVQDGGASYLAEKLQPVSGPEAKVAQLRVNLGEAKKRLLEAITDYRTTDNLEDVVGKRKAVARKATDGLGKIKDQRFPHLLSELQISVRDIHTSFRRRAVGDDRESSGLLRERSGSLENLALLAMERWTERVHEVAKRKPLHDFLGVDAEAVETISRELTSGSERIELQRLVTEAMMETSPVIGADTLFKLAVAAAETINSFVAALGQERLPPGERIRIDNKPVFHLSERPEKLQTLNSISTEEFSKRLIAEWSGAFISMTDSNARGRTVRRFTAEQSVALEAMAQRLMKT